MRKISVIVPVYNAEQTLRACLESLFAVEHLDYEVIVVDDGSTDGTVALASTYPCKLVSLKRNVGAGEARNRGVEHAQGEILAFTDGDCIVPSDWLAKIERALQGDVAGVTGVYAIPDDPSPLARFVGHDIRLRFMHLSGETNVFGTYNGAVLRNVFEQVGGFDPRIRGASWEDVEFGLHVVEKGHKLVIDKDNIVFHQHPETALVYVRKQARKAYGQFLLRSRGRQSDYVNWSAVFQVPLTVSLVSLVVVIPWLGWPACLAALAILAGFLFLNRQLLQTVAEHEGAGTAVRSVWYVLLRNGGWSVGIMCALWTTLTNAWAGSMERFSTKKVDARVRRVGK